MTAAPGFVMLAHRRLDRAAEVAVHLARAGCPVAVHVDARTPAAEHARMVAALAGVEGITLVPRRATPWGGWGLVTATEAAAARLLADHPGLTHVGLISGACLPLRPVEELRAFLAARPGVDFIESVTVADVGWAQGGLDAERFTLRFPFDWQRSRRLFDAAVAVQRRLGLRRRVPGGVVPHLGSQWWMLTRDTLAAVLAHPRRAELARYFRGVWIPDESWFQTMVRLVGARVDSRSLTFARFDVKGRPRVFYDDHLQLLRATDCFLARKIWPGAAGLYRHLLTPAVPLPRAADPAPARVEPVLAAMAARRVQGRAGLWSMARYPDVAVGEPPTAAPHTVLVGVAEVLPGVGPWLASARGARVHGHLFAPGGVQFAGGATVFAGGLSDAARLRDYDPGAFLRNLVWATRGEPQVWALGAGDTPEAAALVGRDPGARVVAVTGAFVIGLWQRGAGVAALRTEAVAALRAEEALLAALVPPPPRSAPGAQVGMRSLADALDDPARLCADLCAAVDPGPMAADAPPPVPDTAVTGAARADLAAFVGGLRDAGVPVRSAGDLGTAAGGPRARPARRPPRAAE